MGLIKPPSSWFANNIQPKNIYYFSSNKISSTESHYFACVLRNGDYLVMSCFTSQFEKKRAFIEKLGLPNSTLVWIAPNEENNLKKDSYINCNSPLAYNVRELTEKYDNDEIKYIGDLGIEHYEQIIRGLMDSPMVTEEIKELLPTLEE